MSLACSCDLAHPPKMLVLTGGPGAGKTALLEIIRSSFCHHVVVLPEAASMLWQGGFPRRDGVAARRAAQRAIARIQLEMQRLIIEEGTAALIVCDRGTLDGAAYWPGDPREFFEELGIDRDRELARYAAVIHLRPPGRDHGYQATSVRTEDAAQAAAIDDRIYRAWDGHPNRAVIESNHDVLRKLERGVALIREHVPACCRR